VELFICLGLSGTHVANRCFERSQNDCSLEQLAAPHIQASACAQLDFSSQKEEDWK